jgi:hypothetical protein
MKLLLLGIALAAGLSAAIPRWSVQEITLTASRISVNPYSDTDLSAEFTGPHGQKKTVRGFWDGGAQFKIRFAPEEEGRWTYRTQSNDPQLDGRSGTIECAGAPTAHGFLRRDPEHPFHWIFDDGTRYFMLGQTYYELIGTARAGADWKRAIDESSRHGLNKVRFRLFVKTCGNRENPTPCSSPYGSDKDHLDLEHWRAADEVMRYLLAKGVIADFMPFNSGSSYFGSPEQDRRLLRYVIARYAAFPNLIWCVTNEYQRTGRPKEYMNTLGQLLRDEDPWIARGSALRGLSIHPLGGKGKGDYFAFGDQTWPVHVILQTGRMDPADVPLNAEILRNREFQMPIADDEYGYFGDALWHNAEGKRGPDTNYYSREKHRNAVWSIYLAGGYASAGDKNQYPDGKPYKTSLWHDAPEYTDLQALVALFTGKGLQWWNMKPANELATGNRVYALAKPGEQYIVYCAAGGDFSLNLPQGAFAATLYDPRTGQERPLSHSVGGQARFSTPAGEDWVIYIKSEARR